jgi:hypothetical protein
MRTIIELNTIFELKFHKVSAGPPAASGQSDRQINRERRIRLRRIQHPTSNE